MAQRRTVPPAREALNQRKIAAQAEQIEIKNEIAKGNYVKAQDVLDVFGDQLAVLERALNNIPRRVTPLLAGKELSPHEVKEIVQKEIDYARSRVCASKCLKNPNDPETEAKTNSK